MDPVSLFDMEAIARLRMAPDLWDYIAGGAADEITIRRNREAFDEIVINPRVLVDSSGREMSTTVLGRRIELPIMAAPPGSPVGGASRRGAARGSGGGRLRNDNGLGHRLQ